MSLTTENKPKPLPRRKTGSELYQHTHVTNNAICTRNQLRTYHFHLGVFVVKRLCSVLNHWNINSIFTTIIITHVIAPLSKIVEVLYVYIYAQYPYQPYSSSIIFSNLLHTFLLMAHACLYKHALLIFAVSPTVNESTTTPESMRYTAVPAAPPLQSQSPKKETQVPSDQDQQNESHVSLDKHHPVPRVRRSESSKPKPPAPLPSPHKEDTETNIEETSPPTEAGKPPPLPTKSALSREIQRSVKKKQSPIRKEPPPPPEPYLSPRHIRTNTSHCTPHCSECYESQQPDAVNETIVDETTPTSTELYIDPTQSQQVLLSGKPKPPRPPPPSKSAIRKAQQRKANTMTGGRHAVKSSSKSAKSNSRTSAVGTGGRHKNSLPSSSLPLASSVSTAQQPCEYEVLDADGFAHQHFDYEDLDAGSCFSPAPPISNPPPLPADNQSRRFSSEPHMEPAPALPPRAPAKNTRHAQRPKKTDSKPIPSGFTRSTSGMDLHSSYEKKHSSDPEKTEREVQTHEYEEDSVYEPVDASLPVLPQRTKRHIKGVQITSCTDKTKTLANIHPVKAPSAVQRAATIRSDPVPRRILPSHSKPISKHTLTARSSFSPPVKLKPSRYVPISSEGKEENSAAKVTQLSEEEDEGGVDEYVDMQCRIGWVEDKDGKLCTHVAMQVCKG